MAVEISEFIRIMSVGISRVPDQNSISRLYNMLEIYHSGLKPSHYCLIAGVSVCIVVSYQFGAVDMC